MQEHVAIQLSKLLKKQHEIEEEIECLKAAQIKKGVEASGFSLDDFLKIKESVKLFNKDYDYCLKLKDLKNQDQAFAEEFYDKVESCTDYMTKNDNGTYTIKLADCTVTYTPRPKFSVIDMNEETKLAAIQAIMENGYWQALDINEENYLQMNKILKEQTEAVGETFENLPGVVDRNFYLKEEFSVRKNIKRSK